MRQYENFIYFKESSEAKYEIVMAVFDLCPVNYEGILNQIIVMILEGGFSYGLEDEKKYIPMYWFSQAKTA